MSNFNAEFNEKYTFKAGIWNHKISQFFSIQLTNFYKMSP